MPTLSDQIALWRKRLVQSQAFDAEHLDELEGHLWDEIDRLVAAGASESEAFAEAMMRLGHANLLAFEYEQEAWSDAHKRPSWQQHPLIPVMLRNYLLISLRNLRKHKSYSFINIAGLAVGLAGAILIALFVRDELSYDRYHSQIDQMYRLVNQTPGQGFDGIAKVAGPWGVVAQNDIPEIEAMTRFIFHGRSLVQRGEQEFYERGGFQADSTVFQVFDFEMLQGNPETALVEPNAIVLTETLAERYFGEESPVGQTLLFNNQTSYTVTGVIADVPENSHFRFPYLVSISTGTGRFGDSWVEPQFYTYFVLADDTSPEVVAAKFRDNLANYTESDYIARVQPTLQPVTDIYLRSNLFREIATMGNLNYVYIFGVIAVFLLVIACINFMNLATARSVERAKEVGVRKVAGASRGMLARQFLSESFVLTFIGLTCAVGLALLALPLFNSLTGKTLTAAVLVSPSVLGSLVMLALIVGLLAGSYPAFLLSLFKPIEVLKGTMRVGQGAGLRKGLVVFQFAISAFLLMATGIVFDQLAYMRDKPLGFDEEQVLSIPIRDRSMADNYRTVKEALSQVPGVLTVSASANQPGGLDYGIPYRAEGVDPEATPSARILVVDHDFVETYGMTMVQGRDFDEAFATDTTAYLMNETAARALGWENPLDEALSVPNIGRDPGPVIGVVQDFHFRSMHEEIAPLLFYIQPTNWLTQFNLRIHTENTEETLAAIENAWMQFDSANPMTFTFVNSRFDAMHRAEVRMGELFTYFTGLAILIACLGLFGLASFTAQQRTKEIGVRKVLGASVPMILRLLTKDIAVLVGLALVLAAPVAYFAMSDWLATFAYRINIGIGTFLLAGAAAFLIAFLTVAYQALKAAVADPVKALRYE